MKTLLLLVLVAVAVAAVRRSCRAAIVAWIAPRLGPDGRHGRRAALTWHVGALGVVLALLAGAWVGVSAGGVGRWAAVAAAVVVLVTYVPATSLGAPPMTRLRKSVGQHLQRAGAAPEAALAYERVARVFSGVGVLVALTAVAVVVAGG